MGKAIRTVELNDVPIPYKLIKRTRHYSFTLSVHAGGRVTLTVPKRANEKLIERFLSQKRAWLERVIKNTPKQTGLSKVDRTHYKAHKEKTRTLVRSRLRELNATYGFVYKRVSIRANTSRWGSCSTQGNLNFDYRILFLPPELQDYILVHELCHLREMNHSPKFWNLVAQTIPHHRLLRDQLRKHALEITP